MCIVDVDGLMPHTYILRVRHASLGGIYCTFYSSCALGGYVHTHDYDCGPDDMYMDTSSVYVVGSCVFERPLGSDVQQYIHII